MLHPHAAQQKNMPHAHQPACAPAPSRPCSSTVAAQLIGVFVFEFIGTILFVFVGTAAAAIGGPLAGAITFGFMLFGLIALFGPLSGGYFNPIATLVSAFMGYLPGGWSVCGVIALFLYWIAQFGGAIVGSLILRRSIGLTGTPVLGVTVPTGTFVDDYWGIVLVEFIASMLFYLVILEFARPGKPDIQRNFAPLAIGSLLLGALMGLGFIGAGASLNFARTLGPAIVSGVYTLITAYLVGQIFGAIGAILVHLLMVWLHGIVWEPLGLVADMLANIQRLMLPERRTPVTRQAYVPGAASAVRLPTMPAKGN